MSERVLFVLELVMYIVQNWNESQVLFEITSVVGKSRRILRLNHIGDRIQWADFPLRKQPAGGGRQK